LPLRAAIVRELATIAAFALAAICPTAKAQTTGDPNAGQQLFTATLSPQCSSCHSTTADATDPRSLTSIRNAITNRATPAGGAATMSFAKALEALDKALTGTTLGGAVTGMNGLFMLSTTQRGDLAAFIAGIVGPTPVLRYSPSSGPIFAATVVGATTSSTATVTNAGTGDLVFATNNAVTMASGGDAADFRVTASTCPGATLRPSNGNCTISVTFQPQAGSSLTRTASIGVTTTTGVSLIPVAGSVVAQAATAPPTSAANPPSAGGGGALESGVAACLFAAMAVRRSRNNFRRNNPACGRLPLD